MKQVKKGRPASEKTQLACSIQLTCTWPCPRKAYWVFLGHDRRYGPQDVLLNWAHLAHRSLHTEEKQLKIINVTVPFFKRRNGMLGLKLASATGNVSEWQARRARGEPSAGGELLAAKPELCGKADWQRLICKPNLFCSVPVPFLDGSLSGWRADWTIPCSRFDKALRRGVLPSRKLPRGVSTWDPTVLSLFDGDADVTSWSKALRYNDRRYCSKYTTSSSKTAISLINSVAGWSQGKNGNEWIKVELISRAVCLNYCLSIWKIKLADMARVAFCLRK